MVTCDVRRAPLVPSGSFTTWTRTSCPSLSRSSILGFGRSRSPLRPAAAASRPRPVGAWRHRAAAALAAALGRRRFAGRSIQPGDGRRRQARLSAFEPAARPTAAGLGHAVDCGASRTPLAGRRTPARDRPRLVLVVAGQPLELLDGVDDFRDVEERVALEADVNEGGLHAGEDFVDPALVDVADNAALILALDEDLDDLVVLEDGDPRLVVARGDDHLLVHGRNSAGLRPPRARRVHAATRRPQARQPARTVKQPRAMSIDETADRWSSSGIACDSEIRASW